MLARCTSSLDLHMLIVPFWYLFGTLLVHKVATGEGHRQSDEHWNRFKENWRRRKKWRDGMERIWFFFRAHRYRSELLREIEGSFSRVTS